MTVQSPYERRAFSAPAVVLVISGAVDLAGCDFCSAVTNISTGVSLRLCAFEDDMFLKVQYPHIHVV